MYKIMNIRRHLLDWVDLVPFNLPHQHVKDWGRAGLHPDVQGLIGVHKHILVHHLPHGQGLLGVPRPGQAGLEVAQEG